MATLANSVGSVRHDLSRAFIITRRELRDMLRDWRIITPIVILTMVFPPLMNFTAGRAQNFAQRYGAPIVAERMFPFLLMVVGFFPISISLVIALETFVGEKERRSLEPLLSTPLSNLQLYIGKMLAATLPPLLGSYLGIIVYLVSLYFNVGWIPPLSLLAMIVVLTTAQGLVMVAGAVVVSAQTTSVRAANLLASFIIIPMAFLVQVEAIVMFWARYNVLWYIVAGLVAANALLVRMGVQIFNREELLGRDIDELDLKRLARFWWQQVRGEPLPEGERARTVVGRMWGWYRREVLSIVPRLKWPALVVIVALVGAVLLGMQRAGRWPLPAVLFQPEQWHDRFGTAIEVLGLQGSRGVLMVFWHNLRVLAIASVLAVFSFGVLAIIIAMLPIGILGYLGTNIYAGGVTPLFFWTAIVPHGTLELPAIILATAGALRLGASVIAPPKDMTVGEGWLVALSDLFKLWLGVVLPLLVIAAVLEVYVTPGLVLAVAAVGG